MQGDRLASGAQSATFLPKNEPAVPKSRYAVEVQNEPIVFAVCRDCDLVVYSAKEFSDHAHACVLNSVAWQAEAA